MKKILIIAVVVVALAQAANALTTTVKEGEVQEIGYREVLTSFGMVRGTITFKLGNYSWAPEEIWLLPENTTKEQFKATSTYLEIPSNITFSTCKTSVYYNESLGYAFKILPSGILPNGTFCGLAYGGTYDVLAR